MVFLHVSAGLPIILAFPLTVIMVTLVGILLDRLAIRPIRQPSVLKLIIATISASIIIKGTAMFIWGKDPLDLPAFSGRDPIFFLGAVIQPQYFWVIGFLIVIVIGLTLFFEKSIIGKAMSACADNVNAASLVGINVKRMILLSFALSAAIGAIAGIIVTPISFMEYDRGAMMAIELVENGDVAKPAVDLTKSLVAAAYKNGLVLLSCGVNSNVIRFLPALTISDELIDEGLDILESCLAEELR